MFEMMIFLPLHGRKIRSAKSGVVWVDGIVFIAAIYQAPKRVWKESGNTPIPINILSLFNAR
jgi:hypothetical protein